MVRESNGRDWSEMLGAFSFPAAILDADFRYVLLNRASATDPLLVRGRVGETDLGCCGEEPVVLEHARARHRQYERSLRTKEPLVFEEEIPMAGQRHLQWICVPIGKAENTQLIVIGLGAGLAGADRAGPAALVELLHKINKELRAPLAALVGLAGTLAQELSGEQQTHASLIDRSGRRLLQRLSLLMDEAEKGSRDNVQHEQG